MNDAGVQFGPDRLQAALADGHGVPLDASIDAAIDALRAWRGGNPFTDDVSMLAVEHTG